MEQGRPPIFDTAESLQKAIENYFKEGVKIKTVVIGKAPNQYSVEIEVPTISGLCYHIGFESRQSFYDYEKREGFSYTVRRARLFIERHYEEMLQTGNTTGAIFALKNFDWKDSQEFSHNGNSYTEYLLNKRDSLILVAQNCPEYTAAIVDRWQELEEQVKGGTIAVPDFSNPVLAARAWADQYEARVLAEQTKAQIGDKREATAMNTASQAVKKANKLEIELDKSKEYATVKRMEKIHHGQPFNWRLLKRTAIEMDMPAIEVFDANYGTVKAYHAEVWREAYALEIEQGRAAA